MPGASMENMDLCSAAESLLLFIKDPSTDGKTESQLTVENQYRWKDYHFCSNSLKKSASIWTKKLG